MEANELRIGNIFDYHGSIVYAQAIATKAIEFGYFLDSIGFIRNIDDNDLPKPMPLTEEWLVKFGFDLLRLNINGNWWRIEKQNSIFVLSNGEDYFELRIQFVHQLQNLYFALTGEELQQIK